MRFYKSIVGLITRFLVKYNLADYYLENLPLEQMCIGCTRDEGDHDGECPIVIKKSKYIVVHPTHTSATYKEQIKELEELYLK